MLHLKSGTVISAAASASWLANSTNSGLVASAVVVDLADASGIADLQEGVGRLL